MKKIQKGAEYDNKVIEEGKKLQLQVIFMLIFAALISMSFYMVLDNNPPSSISQAQSGVDMGNNAPKPK